MEFVYKLFTLSLVPLANTTAIFLLLRQKKRWATTVTSLLACLALGWGVAALPFYDAFSSLYMLSAVPILIWVTFCFEGTFWQKMFTVWCIVNTSVLSAYFVSPIAQLISPFGSDWFYIWQMILMCILYLIEIIAVIIFMRDFFPKMFELKGKGWIVYTLGAVVSRLILKLIDTGERVIAVNVLPPVEVANIYNYYLVLFASAWCFGSIIFTVLVTRQKTLDNSRILNSRNALDVAKNHYAELTASLEEAAALRHDIKYQLNTIAELANKKDWQSISELLDKARKKIVVPLHFCNHAIADALLSWYAKNMKAENIAFRVEAVISSDIPIESADLCVLLGNLLENARKAAGEAISSPYVYLRAKTSKNMLVLEVENSYSGNLQQENGELVSTKESGGHGLKSVRMLCEKHRGEFVTSWTDDKFTALVLLNW
ncbi:MAG: GHKL domain-containing protein [Oscillospiraceae bacterium]|jgi:hypothetical protein|nr:GHKL domain-containing protein [Oscillospiraceae bacterium]